MLAGAGFFLESGPVWRGALLVRLSVLGGIVDESLSLLLVFIQLSSIPSYKDTSHWIQCLLEPILT